MLIDDQQGPSSDHSRFLEFPSSDADAALSSVSAPSEDISPDPLVRESWPTSHDSLAYQPQSSSSSYTREPGSKADDAAPDEVAWRGWNIGHPSPESRVQSPWYLAGRSLRRQQETEEWNGWLHVSAGLAAEPDLNAIRRPPRLTGTPGNNRSARTPNQKRDKKKKRRRNDPRRPYSDGDKLQVAVPRNAVVAGVERPAQKVTQVGRHDRCGGLHPSI
jgi:hypothetical protein